MTIRPATMNDLQGLVVLGEAMHAESPRWSRLKFSRMRLAETLAALIVEPDGLVLIAEKGDMLIGGIAAICCKHWSCDDKVADELSLFVLPEHRGGMAAVRLVCAYRRWAELRGAVMINAGISTGIDPERAAKLYEVAGFTRCAIGLEA